MIEVKGLVYVQVHTTCSLGQLLALCGLTYTQRQSPQLNNGIAPGYIYSEMTNDFLASDAGRDAVKRVPQKRVGEPSDLDGTLLLLASPRASGFMTGTTVIVDGGIALK